MDELQWFPRLKSDYDQGSATARKKKSSPTLPPSVVRQPRMPQICNMVCTSVWSQSKQPKIEAVDVLSQEKQMMAAS